ncbi:hypothetical protein DICVIV_11205 [Dictyocaulus viviparus]|uniref:DUF8117 domain-containing protein n=1 Tax=Dictyocaulus viviparus TaxID=29172 RepID=A0A0D8XDT5_DICVI|nr:hypothetical protein DICVIV_11205 [Dictyocaulus viviparus]
MTLTVSMEDMELFPKDSHLSTNPNSAPVDIHCFAQMHASLERLWWSRLVISVRGYVINYVQNDDETLFHTDDAFICIHRFLAEEKSDKVIAKQSCGRLIVFDYSVKNALIIKALSPFRRFISDLNTVVTYPIVSETLLALCSSQKLKNPFVSNDVGPAFTRIFGQPNIATYRVANGQKYAYIVFMGVLCILQKRWMAERKEGKSIRFETDPEWQPDDRVVLFQEFYKGNRTWVLLDFDRYILAQWRPRGSEVIFGARFLEKKMRAGMELCSWCGMIEQMQNQFSRYVNNKAVCSSQCLEMLLQDSDRSTNLQS